jgi:phosphoribosyl-AMP cyclohydrolase
MANELEEGSGLRLDFGKIAAVAAAGEPVVPVAVQDADSGALLIVAYVNATALAETRQRGVAVFWSTSRRELWIKGAGSGDYLDLVEIRVNCEQNSLLYRVRPRRGGVCHTCGADGQHRPGCYYRRLAADGTLQPVAPP